MIRNSRTAFCFCLLTVFLSTGVANAQVMFVGVGSPEMFESIAVAAFTNVCSARPGSDCHHWSATGQNSADLQDWAQALDSRSVSILPEPGTIFVAWDNNTNPVSVWSYLSVSSGVVAQRLFFAVPRATQQIDSGALTTFGQNMVPAGLLLNRQTGRTQADEAVGIPRAVLTALLTTFTAAVSDVRPEDAKYATVRALAPFNVNGSGLGYSNPANASFSRRGHPAGT